MTTDPQTADLRARIVAAIRTAPFKELRTVDYANGPLQITANVDDLADAVLRAAVPSAPVDRGAVLREVAEIADRAAAQCCPQTAAIVAGLAAEFRLMAIGLLGRVADEEQPEGSAPEETLDLADGPVRCPLCPHTVTLHTPNGARAHFTHVHPEERLVGSGPWPLLANRADEEQQPETQADADLPARLEAALTERFTELGNPFSEMRRREQGPDGWPSSHPVGPHQVAEVLRELLATDAPAAVAQPEIVHGCPPDGSGLTPCCGRTPFELPLTDRISSEAPVTCRAAVAQPGKEAQPIPCNAVHLRVHHAGHQWEPQPGMDRIPCAGYPAAAPQPEEA